LKKELKELKKELKELKNELKESKYIDISFEFINYILLIGKL